jgi:hypothetical protein
VPDFPNLNNGNFGAGALGCCVSTMTPVATYRPSLVIHGGPGDAQSLIPDFFESSRKIVVSKDGKSRTVTTQTTNAEGKKVENVGVYDKQ